MGFLSSDIINAAGRARTPDEREFVDAIRSARRLYLPRAVIERANNHKHATRPAAALTAAASGAPALWVEYEPNDGKGGRFREGYLLRNHDTDVSVTYAMRHRGILRMLTAHGVVLSDGPSGRMFWQQGACPSESDERLLGEAANVVTVLLEFLQQPFVTLPSPSERGCEEVA